MDLQIDSAEKRFSEILEETTLQIAQIETEEETKIKIINRILFEVLDWKTSSIRAESKHDNGFSDYVIYEENNPVFLIEAKRKGLLPIITAEKDVVKYLKLSGTSLTKCNEGIEQAAKYTQNSGTVFAVLTDGISWVIFKTFVVGADYKSKEAVVFPSLTAVQKGFPKFFELLSRQAVSKRLYNVIFDDLHNKRLNLTQELYSPIDETEIKISQKSSLAFDLERVFERYFAAMAGSDDDELILECFVESKESRIADFSLEKMTANVLGNIGYGIDVNNQLTQVISDSISVTDGDGKGQTVFIVGPTGSGKTTFLDRFFKKTLSRSIKEKCVLLNINCLDATGSEETILDWLTEELISAIEMSIYEDSGPDWNQLRTLYSGEYLRRKKGVDAHLYDSDKSAFKVKFGDFLNEQVENKREEYLKRLLKEIVRNRKMLPIFVVDNTDENTILFKQKVFQFFQSLLRLAEHSLLIFPVTDRSAWSFSKTDIFSIYESKSFFLPTPSPRDVFRKRVEYLKDKIELKTKKENKNNYFSDKGIRISIENLEGFTKVLESIFVDHEFTSKTIGQLTNYNIRKTLILSKRVLTSSVIKVEDLIKSYIVGKPITTKYTRFIDALLRGNFSLYKKGDESEIIPIFDIDLRIKQSPLLKIRILSLLSRALHNGKNIEEKHLGVQSIVGYFDAIGGNETSIESAILYLLESKLIEPYDISTSGISHSQKVAISHKGKIHLSLATRNSVYFYQMALTTSIIAEDVSDKIRNLYKGTTNFQERIVAIKEVFAQFLLSEDQKFFNQEIDRENYECQSELLSEISKFQGSSKKPENDLISTMGDQFKEDLVKTDVLCLVAWYDPKKRYGYANVEELDEGVFFHLDRLLECGISYITENDKILCDISRSNKGLQIDKIYDVEIDSNSIEQEVCTILRVFDERSYGFAAVGTGDHVAYFHTYLFPEASRSTLVVGQQFSAEVVLDSNSGSYQIRSVLSST